MLLSVNFLFKRAKKRASHSESTSTWRSSLMFNASIIFSTYMSSFPWPMNLVSNSASSSANAGHNLSNPSLNLILVTFLIPSNPSTESILLKLYFFCLIKATNSLNLTLLWSKLTFLFQSSKVISPSLLLSSILNNYKHCCSVISIDTSLQAFHTSLYVNTPVFLLHNWQKDE